MKDKNGKEIQDCSFLRIKFKMYEEEVQYDGIYFVQFNDWEGASLRLVEIFEPEETFHTLLTWKRGDLTFDYKSSQTNPHYSEYLAIDRKEDSSGPFNRDWATLRHYSNNIEIVENYQLK